MEHAVCAKYKGTWYYADIHVTIMVQQKKKKIAFHLPDDTKIAFYLRGKKGTTQTEVILDHGNMPLFKALEATNQKAAEILYGDC